MIEVQQATEVAEILLVLSRADALTEAGRARLVAGLRDVLARLGADGCGRCPLSAAGVGRAIASLNATLADASDHAEYLALVMAPRPRGPA